MSCKNPRELMMPKRITLTMANTLFGALSGVRPVNWGLLIHETVARAIPYIGQKPSYLTPFIMHLYTYYGCSTVNEDDLLLIALVLNLGKLPDPTRHMVMLHGETWICPRGSFPKTPFSRCLMTWRILRPCTTGWSTSPGNPTTP